MDTYKVVINTCHGGFGLSRAGRDRLVELGYTDDIRYIRRHDPRLVRVIEELGTKASGRYAQLVIVKITDPEYIIEEYDGMESVTTKKQIHWIDARSDD